MPTPSASLYPITLAFTKFFKRGSLKGIRVPDSIGHVSRERAEDWLKAIAANYKCKVINYVVENPVISPTPTESSDEFDPAMPKGFVMWANNAHDAFFYSTGTDVYRAPINSVPDVTTGYVQGRWECTVEHWNRYAEAYARVAIHALSSARP